MKCEELFDYRKVFAEKLNIYLREKGYTKISFAKKTNISRPTLDKILKGEIDSKNTFDKHIQKIVDVLKVNIDDIMYYVQTKKEIEAVYSTNEPADYVITKKEKEEMELLQDVLDICAIYY